jgi:hypothetical protein
MIPRANFIALILAFGICSVCAGEQRPGRCTNTPRALDHSRVRDHSDRSWLADSVARRPAPKFTHLLTIPSHPEVARDGAIPLSRRVARTANGGFILHSISTSDEGTAVTVMDER